MGEAASAPFKRPIRQSLVRGLMNRCPRCGIGRVRLGYLQVVPYCGHCGERLGHIRADDGPAYFTVFLVAHIVVPIFLLIEQMAHPPIWLMLSVGIPVTLLLTLVLLPVMKSGTVGLMWAHRLRGDEHVGEG
jgi:uncharacterized protein (DUF983 family)